MPTNRRFSLFGHARLVTNGSQLHEVNNQPVMKDGILIIHNGIIVNADELWEKYPEINTRISDRYRNHSRTYPQRAGNNKGCLASCNNTFKKLKEPFPLHDVQ